MAGTDKYAKMNNGSNSAKMKIVSKTIYARLLYPHSSLI